MTFGQNASQQSSSNFDIILYGGNSSRHLCVQSPPPQGFITCHSLSYIIFMETVHVIFASSSQEQLTPFLRPVPNITFGRNSSRHLCVQYPTSRSGRLPSTYLAFKIIFYCSFSVACFIKVLLSNKTTHNLTNGLWFFRF